MSFNHQFTEVTKLPSVPLRTSITLLKSMPSSIDGRFVSVSEFVEDSFIDSPYNSMSITDFSISSLLAAGADPSRVFVQSSDVDTVMNSADNLFKSLQDSLKASEK